MISNFQKSIDDRWWYLYNTKGEAYLGMWDIYIYIHNEKWPQIMTDRVNEKLKNSPQLGPNSMQTEPSRDGWS